MAQNNIKRLAVKLPSALHRDFKEAARKRNLTISRYIIRLMVAALKAEHVFD